MRLLSPAHAARAALALAVLTACGGAGERAGSDSATVGSAPSSADAPAASATAHVPLAFTAADLEAYERGIAREAELVRAARERGAKAATPEERGAAAQAEWDDATIPGGAEAAGLPVARYRQLRETVHHVLQTLDFQGKIDGPQSLDTANAPAEMKARLASDPFAELAPASAAALRARLDSVARAYVGYMQLVALHG